VEQGRRLTEDLLGAEPPLQPECSGGGRARPLGAMAASGASRKRIVLGITGSVAAVKGPRLALELCKAGCDVRIVLTARGEHFWKLAETYDPESWKAVSHVPGAVEPCSTEQLSSLLSSPAETCSVEAVLRDSDEWGAYHVVKKDPVLHIEVRLVCVCERERERFFAGSTVCISASPVGNALAHRPHVSQHPWEVRQRNVRRLAELRFSRVGCVFAGDRVPGDEHTDVGTPVHSPRPCQSWESALRPSGHTRLCDARVW
jgi:hypothetical protein